MANTANMALPLDPYVGQANPTQGPTWAADLETMKGIVDVHVHGPPGSAPGPAAVLGLLLAHMTANGAIPTAKAAINFVAVDPSIAPFTATLPSAAGSIGCLFIIKDVSGGASLNNVIVSKAGSDTIDGVSTNTISTDYGVLRLLSITGFSWSVV